MPRNGDLGRAKTLGALLVALVATLALLAQPASAAGTECTKVAAPSGSDSAAGSVTAPYRTVQRLVDSLGAGETGCLRAGTYGGAALYMRKPDTALQSYPGERATLTAFLEVTPEAPRSRVSGLKIDTSGNSNSVGTKLQADDAVLSGNEITKGSEGICVLAGTYNAAQRVVIERNYIHDCGAAVKPDGSTNKFDHLIYLSGTRNAVVRWNILSANDGGWGVHMYPGADGTLVEHNIIDGNQGGVIFAGSGSGSPSDNNVVRNNAITGNGPRWNIESSWSGGPAGTGNVASHNCVYGTGPSQPSGISSGSGFTATGNTVLGGYPYVDRGAGDYRFREGSPCAGLVGDVVGAVAGVPASSSSGSAPSQPQLPVEPEEGDGEESEEGEASDPGEEGYEGEEDEAGGEAEDGGESLEIVIRADSHRLSAQRPVRVEGSLMSSGSLSVASVGLQIKARGGAWKTILQRPVRSGSFSARITAKQVRTPGTAQLRAIVPGLASSEVVQIRVAGRSHR